MKFSAISQIDNSRIHTDCGMKWNNLIHLRPHSKYTDAG